MAELVAVVQVGRGSDCEERQRRVEQRVLGRRGQQGREQGRLLRRGRGQQQGQRVLPVQERHPQRQLRAQQEFPKMYRWVGGQIIK